MAEGRPPRVPAVRVPAGDADDWHTVPPRGRRSQTLTGLGFTEPPPTRPSVAEDPFAGRDTDPAGADPGYRLGHLEATVEELRRQVALDRVVLTQKPPAVTSGTVPPPSARTALARLALERPGLAWAVCAALGLGGGVVSRPITDKAAAGEAAELERRVKSLEAEVATLRADERSNRLRAGELADTMAKRRRSEMSFRRIVGSALCQSQRFTAPGLCPELPVEWKPGPLRPGEVTYQTSEAVTPLDD